LKADSHAETAETLDQPVSPEGEETEDRPKQGQGEDKDYRARLHQ
jgi:hypothetical protein